MDASWGSQTEVEHFRPSLGKHDVRRLQIAVYNALMVRRIERAGLS